MSKQKQWKQLKNRRIAYKLIRTEDNSRNENRGSSSSRLDARLNSGKVILCCALTASDTWSRRSLEPSWKINDAYESAKLVQEIPNRALALTLIARATEGKKREDCFLEALAAAREYVPQRLMLPSHAMSEIAYYAVNTALSSQNITDLYRHWNAFMDICQAIIDSGERWS